MADVFNQRPVTIQKHRAGLGHAIRLAAADRPATMQMGRRAATAAEKYSQDAALARYRDVILGARGELPRPSR